MRILISAFLTLGVCAPIDLAAQDSVAVIAARAIDDELLKLRDLPDRGKPSVVKDLARRIRQQPGRYAVPLAFNLAIEVGEESGRAVLQDVTTTLADALRRSPGTESDDYAYLRLAEFARYYRMQVSLDAPEYRAAHSKLESNDRQRSISGFTLADMQDQQWNLKSLRGKVVLVNFWATWCPPCRTEIPDLNALYVRFQRQGLVILAISDEEESILKKFLAQHSILFPVLLDPGGSAKKQFLVRGIPHSLVYDRAGKLVAQAIDRPTRKGFLAMLRQAGLQ